MSQVKKEKVWSIYSFAFPFKDNNDFSRKCNQESSLHSISTDQLRSKAWMEGKCDLKRDCTSSRANCALAWSMSSGGRIQLYALTFHRNQLSPGINTALCVRARPAIYTSPRGDSLAILQWRSSPAHLPNGPKQLQCTEPGMLRALNRNACPLLPKHSLVATCHLKWVCGMQRPFTVVKTRRILPRVHSKEA